ncbi:hypothetical protein [Ichthyenterobacterium magnum]|uniref:Glycerophosphoryl diester phosphodiesterase family protein n=1 Tax=Ichthyenterobacterium magnum TaxID=1230530 RepID=A0A420DVJ9_9FLAO|nr:hypothetical protein [Ichthyenterobacterium magnum]RKE98245.1 hypothetical protein BXY80_0323 [Ichthyenterobacterium magnum]
MLFSEIQYKIQNARELDFGTILNQSIELFKKVWLQGLLMLLIALAFAIPIIMIFYVPLVVFSVFDTTNPGSVDAFMPFLALSLVIGYIILMLAILVISFALKAALFRIFAQKDFNTITKEDYLYFLKKPYLRKTIKVSLAYVGIMILATLLCFFPVIYVMVPLNLLVVVYAFNPDLTTSNLIKVSFELGNKKWFITFGLTFVAAFLAEIVGLLMCGIGILATASFVAIPVYFIYKEVVGFDNKEINQIENL